MLYIINSYRNKIIDIFIRHIVENTHTEDPVIIKTETERKRERKRKREIERKREIVDIVTVSD